ncbi:MAG: malate synthase [Cocleimonas sp.]|jgi:malate synthase
MTTVSKDKLSIDQKLHDLIVNDIIPGTGIDVESFWKSFQDILNEFMPKNRELLDIRDEFQAKIDAWHLENRENTFDAAAYKQFLSDIGYIIVKKPEHRPRFNIRTENIDPEIATIAGPQLVVPINNARFALNAANARWGSLFDAFYGTDVIPDEGEYAKGKKFNDTRGEKVISLSNEFLDKALPLKFGFHTHVTSYQLTGKPGEKRGLAITLDNGVATELENNDAFIGYTEQENSFSLLFKHNGTHIEIQVDPNSPIGQLSKSGVKDVILESALTTIQDCEDSVAAVDAEDKILVYKNWLGLMKGDLEETMEKNGKSITRKLNANRKYEDLNGKLLVLSGRSILLVRNVGHLMNTDAITYDGENIPEGIMDGVVTALCSIHDFRGNSPYKNSRQNSQYIVKPKMHGPEEVRFTVDLFGAIENALNLPKNTMKIGIMDEERRTSCNLRACIYEARERLIFINTGFLDRTGDEIHTSMEAGPFLPKNEIKNQPWIKSYEDRNVDSGLACGLKGKAQIGKGMWAMPDLMSDMLEQKIGHPLSGANCAWVPSPTAATLHAMHYHYVKVSVVQDAISERKNTPIEDLITIPLMPKDYVMSEEKLVAELNDSAQSILGYVVRWIDQGVGCSKVLDSHNVGLMEDRATLRISSQIIANWLHHDLCTEKQVTEAFKRMAVLVDNQNASDPLYNPMAPGFDGTAFKAALELALKGAEQPNGYTEPLLHQYRYQLKREQS